MTDLDSVPLIQARHFTPGRTVPVALIVIHDMEAAESSSTAENCARYFATTDVRASCHYCCDDDSTVCSVRPEDTAWHTGHGPTNACSIGIEQAGFASQSVDEWNDVYSHDMIFGEVAPLVAALAQRYGIPLVFLSAADLKAGNFSGVTTHAAISEAFVPGGHTDPGPNYPMAQMLAAARPAPTPPPTPQESDVQVTKKIAQVNGKLYGIRYVDGQPDTKQWVQFYDAWWHDVWGADRALIISDDFQATLDRLPWYQGDAPSWAS